LSNYNITEVCKYLASRYSASTLSSFKVSRAGFVCAVNLFKYFLFLLYLLEYLFGENICTISITFFNLYKFYLRSPVAPQYNNCASVFQSSSQHLLLPSYEALLYLKFISRNNKEGAKPSLRTP